MGNDILLTIAIPTYKRAPFLDENLTILGQQVACKNLPIEVIVSDNCSPDNTGEVVERHIAAGMAIRYIRNESNLGMDGNFVNCFKHAEGKYCWVLGDDDYLKEGVLEYILNLINKGDYGLVHLRPVNHKEKPPTIYKENNSFFRDVNHWLTYISSNIVKTCYVNEIDFDNYMGTFFTIMPLYITAAAKQGVNVIVNKQTFCGGADVAHNGGYNFFEVFAQNFNLIIKEFATKGYYSYSTYRHIKMMMLKRSLGFFIINMLISKKIEGNFILQNSWKTLFRNYRSYPQFYFIILYLYFKYFVKTVFTKLGIMSLYRRINRNK